MTLGTELARHRDPLSSRRFWVLRRRRDLWRYGCRSCAPFPRTRHDNPVSRVSVALSTESHQSRRNPGIRCAATLLAASRTFERNPLDPRSWAVPTNRQGSANSKTWVRQLCAKGQMRRSRQRTKRRRDERPVINPPTDNGSTATRAKSISPAGRAEPSHQSVSNPVKDPVKNPVRNPPTAGQTQRPRTRECLTTGDTRKKRTWK